MKGKKGEKKSDKRVNDYTRRVCAKKGEKDCTKERCLRFASGSLRSNWYGKIVCVCMCV